MEQSTFAEKSAWACRMNARMCRYTVCISPCMCTCTHTRPLSLTLSTTHNGTVNPEGASFLHGQAAVRNTLLQWETAVRNTCNAIMLRAAVGDALHADDAKLIEDARYVGRGQR